MTTLARIGTAVLALPFLAVAWTSPSPAAAVSGSIVALMLLLPNLIAVGIRWSTLPAPSPQTPTVYRTQPPDSTAQPPTMPTRTA